MNDIKRFVLIMLSCVLILSVKSCIHDNFDEPPLKTIPEGKVLTISDIENIYNDSVLSLNKTHYEFTDDYSLFATVVMDEKSGNIYREVYVQDYDAGLNVKLTNPGGVYLGDSIRLYLKGTKVSAYRNMIQLENVNSETNIIKQATGKNIPPTVVTINDILSGNFKAQLVKLEDVQFASGELGNTFADHINRRSESRTIENCFDQTIIARTSGYASFAGDTLPEGRGSVVAVVSLYNETWQLVIRSLDEVKFDNKRCGEVTYILFQDFTETEHQETIELSGWQNINENGDLKWQGFFADPVSAARISNNQEDNNVWLITPQVELTENSMLNFDVRSGNINGADLKILISSDYDGNGNPELASWQELEAEIPTPSSGFSNYENSGNIELLNITEPSFVAFKYAAEGSGTGTYIITNISIYNE